MRYVTPFDIVLIVKHKKPANGEDCLHFCLIANVVQQWTYIMWNEMLPSISANRDAPPE